MAQLRHCIFCGPTSREITGEHVYPQWLSELFRDAGVKRYSTRRARSTGSALLTEKTRAAVRLDLKINDVCRKCNNEDLSDLEDNYAKPILIPLITASKVVTLSAVEQVVLTAWITKMAMVYEWTDSRAKFFTQSEREFFMTAMEPVANTWIWLAQCRTRHVTVASSHSLFLKKRPRDGLKVFVLTMVIGHLAFQLLVRRDGNFRQTRFVRTLDRWRNATVRIFPEPQDGLVVSPPQYIGDRALKPFADRWGGVTKADYW